MMKSLSLAVALAVGSTLVMTHGISAQDNAALVKERQDLMRAMGGSFRPIVAVVRGDSDDLDAAKAAAMTMNDAIVKQADLYPEGTAKGEVEGSRAKPEVWSDMAGFEAARQALEDATAALVAAAESGDVAAFQAAFGPVGQTCGGCHEGDGAAGGKYRFPRDG